MSSPSRLRIILGSLPLLAALCGGCDNHHAPVGQQVSGDTVVATFDPTGASYRNITISLAPRGAPGAGEWHFDLFDPSNNRLNGVKTHWESSNPAIVMLPAADLTTTATDVMWETVLQFQGLAPGDAILTGTVVGAKTVNDAPVSITVNVHVTGPGASITVTPQVQAAMLNLDPTARKMGDDTVSLVAEVRDATGAPIVGAQLDWSCAGAPTDAEFTSYDVELRSVVGAGCTTGTSDYTHHSVDIRAYRTGAFGFHVALQGAPEVSADAVVVIVGAGAHLEVDPPAVALVVGGTRAITGTVVDTDGSRYPAGDLKLLSQNVAVANWSAENVIHGMASGAVPGEVQSTTVTASVAGNLSAQIGVIVYRPPASLVVTPDLTLATGGQGTVSAALLDTDGVTVIPPAATTLTWTTHDAAVATVAPTTYQDTATVSALAAGTTEVRATTAEGVSGVAAVTVTAGGSGAPGCYPECIEALRRTCVPSGGCTTNSTPPAPFSDTFYFCYDDGVRIVSMSTSTGTRHTQYRPDGSVCFVIDTSFSGSNGRNVTEVWQDGTGAVVGTETYDSLASDGGQTHAVSCGGQTFSVDSGAPGCGYPDCSVQDASCM